MKHIACSYMWWAGFDASIETVAKGCCEYEATKNSPPVAPLQPRSWPLRVFERVHIDFAGPFQGATFLVAVDAHSKWPFVEILQSTIVTKTIDVLRQMFSMFGIPAHVVTDNGPQFTAEEFAVFMAGNGIKHTRSAPCTTFRQMDLPNVLSRV